MVKSGPKRAWPTGSSRRRVGKGPPGDPAAAAAAAGMAVTVREMDDGGTLVGPSRDADGHVTIGGGGCMVSVMGPRRAKATRRGEATPYGEDG